MSGARISDDRLANLEDAAEERVAYGRGGIAPGKRTLTANLFSSRPRLATPDLMTGKPPGAGAAGPGQTAGPLLVEGDGPVGPNQMAKSQFLAEAATIMPGEDLAPWEARSCAAIEAELKKSVPATAGARSARDYLGALRSQATQPANGAPAGGLAALLASPDEHAAADFMRSGQMGPGQPLSGAARSAMESAFLHSFSDVRVHTSEPAGQLASALGARAFTVGNQIAFAPGLYDPGSPLGDALLAHELAHVVQQHGASSLGGGGSGALEADADHAAALAVSALHGGEMSARAPAKPSLQSGLSLQRCPGGGGGGGGGGALTFSSSAFAAGAGGAVTATPGAADLQIASSAYSSSGTVQATGGTNADAAGWDVGYLQTVTSLTPIGTYTRPAGGAPTQLAITVPNNTRDGNPAGVAPWYDSANPAGTKPFTTTGSTETVTLWDQPRMSFPWDTPDGVGKLAKTAGKAKFAAWVAVRKRAAPNTIQYINWESWEVDFSTTTNYAASGAKTVAGITGATTSLGSGAGQGANTPNLTGTVGNNLLTFTWT